LTSIKRIVLRQAALQTCLPLCLAWWTCAAAATVDDGVVTARFANGINARVYTAGYLASLTVAHGTRGALSIGEGEQIEVITDVNDPLITNKGDGSFHSLSTSLVLDCLDRIEYPGMNVDVDVFVLPYPRVNVLSSSAVGRRVFLSPNMREVSPEGAAYTIAHEMGHVFQYCHVPVSTNPRWEEYSRIRGILGDPRFSDSSPHAYRPREIFAEDFRVLFGGPLAFFGGRVENPELESPVTVAGLEEFCIGLTRRVPGPSAIASVTSYPNPFNPQTELRVALGSDYQATNAVVTVRIYDVRGALVRELYAGQPVGPDMRVPWDGRDGEGRQVASSTYFGVVEAGNARVTTKLLMIK
jgi:hypothetical protein